MPKTNELIIYRQKITHAAIMHIFINGLFRNASEMSISFFIILFQSGQAGLIKGSDEKEAAQNAASLFILFTLSWISCNTSV